jgi:hypothetical protein
MLRGGKERICLHLECIIRHHEEIVRHQEGITKDFQGILRELNEYDTTKIDYHKIYKD